MLDTDKLSAEIRKRGWKPSELARRAGMTPQQWTDLASGRKPNPSTWTLQRIAKAIGCSPCDLLNDAEPPTARTKQGKQRGRKQHP